MSGDLIFEYLLVIAGSGRMLAQAAKHAGLKPLVIDLFADLDTQAYAEDFLKIASLAEADLTPAVDFFIKRYAATHVIYGSGFEYYPESLYYLSSRLMLLGNTPDAFTRLQNKPEFFAVLSDLHIPYPEVSFKAPDGAAWLVKPVQGQGGVGIKRYRHGCPELCVYWQKYQQGRPQSVLFLADGRTVQIIGFNTQWTVESGTGESFIFSGIINSSGLSDKQKTVITGWLAGLVAEFDLKGLNSLDFMQDGDCLYVLEINPRLSASMQLYNDAGLLLLHIQASQGHVAPKISTQDGYAGYQIIYAEQDVIIPDTFEWPGGCVDLPSPGVICRKGQPICSIIARHSTPLHVFEQLQRKQQYIFNQLHIGSSSWNTQRALINFPSL